jgi:hypothetical protein
VVVRVGTAGKEAGAFVFTPSGGSLVVSGQSRTIQISAIQVSTVVGTAPSQNNIAVGRGVIVLPPNA